MSHPPPSFELAEAATDDRPAPVPARRPGARRTLAVGLRHLILVLLALLTLFPVLLVISTAFKSPVCWYTRSCRSALVPSLKIVFT